jgi:hypothetical protein
MVQPLNALAHGKIRKGCNTTLHGPELPSNVLPRTFGAGKGHHHGFSTFEYFDHTGGLSATSISQGPQYLGMDTVSQFAPQVGHDRCAERWGARDGKNQSPQGPPNAGGGVPVTGWPCEISSSEYPHAPDGPQDISTGEDGCRRDESRRISSISLSITS